jgi:RND family efflux transporter MFP subunit
MSNLSEEKDSLSVAQSEATANSKKSFSQTLLAFVKGKPYVLPIVILGGTAVVCALLIFSRPQISQAPVEPPITAIRTIETKSERITLSVSSRGKVQPAMISEVSAAVNGPVAWISPSLVAGGYFKQGDTILRIDNRDYQTALEKTQAAKKQAEAEASHAARELERLTDLAKKKLASDSQLQDIKRAADVAAARLLNAEADLHQAQLNLARTELKAPFDAIVEVRNIELGQNVSPGQSVATLYGADVVEVKLPLANRQIGFLTISPSFRGAFPTEQAPDVLLKGLYAGRQHSWQGKLVRTEAGIDVSNNTVQAIVQVKQPRESDIDDDESLANIPLPIGLLVQADISGRTVDNVIALPRHVIRKNTQVLVAAPDDTLHIREVDILRLERDRVLIQGGLKAGEKVCVSPIQAVVDGMRIRIVNDAVNSEL